jgi:predicted ATP-dependent protease
VNQHGVIQPIGGVNEKIEGFFDLCRARGLTGEQGVIIPFSNEKHLMLRDDVIAAVERGEFQICSVRTVYEGMELLTGLPMGELDSDGAYPAESVNGRVKARLEEFARRRKRFIARPNGEVDVAGGGGDGAEQESHQPEQKKGANHE